jgi:hypothetical protein
MDDDAKRTILARRARFVAAALSGVAVAGCDRCNPLVCLEPPLATDGGATTTTTTRPTACLKPVVCLAATVEPTPAPSAEDTTIGPPSPEGGRRDGGGGRDGGAG